MAEVTVDFDFDQSAAALWAVVGDFCGIGDWMPGMERVEPENGGNRRRIVLPGGKVVIEDIVSRDDDKMTLTYRVVEAPMPFTDYVSTVSVQPRGDGCHVRWAGSFTPVGPEEKVVRLVRNLYGGGLKALQGRLGGP